MKLFARGDNSRAKMLVAAIVVLLFVIVVVLVRSNTRVDNQLFEERSSNIVNVTEKSADMMNLMLEDAASSLLSAEKVITATDATLDTDAQIVAFTQDACAIQRRSGQSDYVVLVDGDSKYHMMKSNMYLTGSWANFDVLTAADTGMSVSVTTLPGLGNQTYLALTKKYEGYGTLSGAQGGIRYVMVCINTNDLSPAFDEEMFNQQNFYYVVDANGHRVFRYIQGSNAIETSNVFYALENSEVIQGATIDDLKQSVATGQTASSEINHEGTSYYVSVVPLSVNDWMVLMFVPTQTLSASATSFVDANTRFVVELVVLFTLLLVCVALLGIDLVNRQRAAEAQKEINEQLALANELVVQASEAKTDFLFNMSHDIRTPINAIVGFTNMAIDNADDPQLVKDSLQKAQQASSLLVSLINDILEMSRIESGKMTLSRDKVDIAEVLEKLQPVIDELAKQKDHTVVYEVENLSNRHVYADALRLDRVLVNLLSNAVKYTPTGGRIEARIRELPHEREGWSVYEFTIADNGIGMSKDFQKEMFNTFTREENSTTSHVQGTGLGLALCKSISDLMDAELTCASEKGVGSTFVLTVPLELLGTDEQHEESQQGDSMSLAWIAGMRCLLVEDNELNREIATYFLEDMGMTVEEAEDGIVAVDMLKERGAMYYDVVLMDIQMPRMNGYDATRAIREMYPDVHIPIVALSANAFAEDKRKSLEYGMDGHVAKPFVLDEITQALYTAIKKRGEDLQ